MLHIHELRASQVIPFIHPIWPSSKQWNYKNSSTRFSSSRSGFTPAYCSLSSSLCSFHPHVYSGTLDSFCENHFFLNVFCNFPEHCTMWNPTHLYHPLSTSHAPIQWNKCHVFWWCSANQETLGSFDYLQHIITLFIQLLCLSHRKKKKWASHDWRWIHLPECMFLNMWTWMTPWAIALWWLINQSLAENFKCS